jgi:hypothetical protein
MKSGVNNLLIIILLNLGAAHCTRNAPKDPPILAPAPAVDEEPQVTNESSPRPLTPSPLANERSFLLVTSRDDIAKFFTPSTLTALLAEADQTKVIVTTDPNVFAWDTTLGSLKDASEVKWNVKIPESSVPVTLTVKILARNQKEILTAQVVITPGSQGNSIALPWKQGQRDVEIPPSPQPTPAPPSPPAPSPPAPSPPAPSPTTPPRSPDPVVPSDLKQWDGQSDLGGTIWTIETAP